MFVHHVHSPPRARQLPVARGDKAANLATIARVLRAHEGSGRELFVFPELSLCGFPPGRRRVERDYAGEAEAVPEGPSAARVVALARQYGVFLCAGLVEKDQGKLFLTHFLCGPEGYLGKQRKLFSQDPRADGPLSAGEKVCIFEVLGQRCAILACADWVLPEGAYLAGLAEATLILAPTDGFELSYEGMVRAVALARTLDGQAALAITFGECSIGSQVLAGLVTAPAGRTSQVLLCETRGAEEVKVMPIALEVHPPQQDVWGGFRPRSEAFVRKVMAQRAE